MVSEQAITNQQQIADIRRRMQSGEITYAQAKAEAQPIIDRINDSAKAIAKRHGKRASKVNFAGIMR